MPKTERIRRECRECGKLKESRETGAMQKTVRIKRVSRERRK